MERPIFKPIGSPVEELDTPALVVDLDRLESNIDTAHSFFEGRASKLRPRVSIHGCPAVAHMQLAAPGTVGGVSVVTLGQAEAFSASGINDFSIGSVVVTAQKIARLCGLARHASVVVVVDSMANIADLSAAASAAGVEIKVLVAIATRPDRIGVDPGQPAVDLAKAAAGSEGLTFDGFKTHEGTLEVEDVAALAEESPRLDRARARRSRGRRGCRSDRQHGQRRGNLQLRGRRSHRRRDRGPRRFLRPHGRQARRAARRAGARRQGAHHRHELPRGTPRSSPTAETRPLGWTAALP